MTQDFWWYLLIGFLIGFALSTLWEWLYFRSKRMRLENRRIAELDAALRAALATQPQRAETPLWPAADYQSPAIYLESEGAMATVETTYPQPAVAVTGFVAGGAGQAVGPMPPPQAAAPHADAGQLAAAAGILAAAAAAHAVHDEAAAKQHEDAATLSAANPAADTNQPGSQEDEPQQDAGSAPSLGQQDSVTEIAPAAEDLAHPAQAGGEDATLAEVDADAGARAAAVALADLLDEQAQPVAVPQAAGATAVSVEDDGDENDGRLLAAALAAGATVLAAAMARDEEVAPETEQAGEAVVQAMPPHPESELLAEPAPVTATATQLVQEAAGSPAQASGGEPAQPPLPVQTAPPQQTYTMNNLSRSDYATVRILQSVRRSARKGADRIGLGRFLPPETAAGAEDQPGN